MDAPLGRSGAKLWKYPVGVLAVIAPLVFIWPLDVGMAGGEYELNAWFIGYNGEYFRHHHAFPETLQTSDRLGSAAPVFYGYLLFKVAGLFGLVGGPHLAVRLIVLLCFAATYLTVRHTLRRFRATEALATAAACAVCWATYPLTNLYNRFAFAEFVAGSCLTCSCCLWAVFFLRPRRSTGWATALAAGFFLVLAAGSHPITGMLSVPFLVLLYLLQWTVPVSERPGALRRHAALVPPCALALLVLSPWLYAYSKLGKELAIAATFHPALGYFDGGNWTGALIRLAPIPMDYQHFNRESPRLGVAHLDTQINVPLLASALVLLAACSQPLGWARRGRLALVLAPVVALGAAGFVISVYRTGFEGSTIKYPNFPSFLWKIQYAYRLVTVVNLAVLIALLAALAYRRAVAGPARVGLPPFALGAVVALAATGLMVKLIHGKESVAEHRLPIRNADPEYERWLLARPFPASQDYVTLSSAELPADEAARLSPRPFPVGSGRDFGRALPLRVNSPAEGFVATQAVPFKWHTFRVDGELVPPERLRLWHDLRPGQAPCAETARVAVPVPAGEHTVEYAWTPPRKWAVLNAVSPWLLACWLVGLVTVPVVRALRRARSVPAPAEPQEDRPPPLARAA